MTVLESIQNSSYKQIGFNSSIPTKHNDSVTDVNVLNTNFGNILVSSSRDGTIKLFK
jgi:hypothetical protein